ncbi:MAG: hypothetical protein HQ567_13435 [Candidatus Nealsonbacteria bacterium]|nr:hypothetical protein [Candidatus Nealsonbacteria bacterium]
MAIYRGRVSNGVVKQEGDVRLPEGTQVIVETLDVETPGAETPADGDDPVYRLAELAVPTGIPDLSLIVGRCGYQLEGS